MSTLPLSTSATGLLAAAAAESWPADTPRLVVEQSCLPNAGRGVFLAADSAASVPAGAAVLFYPGVRYGADDMLVAAATGVFAHSNQYLMACGPSAVIDGREDGPSARVLASCVAREQRRWQHVSRAAVHLDALSRLQRDVSAASASQRAPDPMALLGAALGLLDAPSASASAAASAAAPTSASAAAPASASASASAALSTTAPPSSPPPPALPPLVLPALFANALALGHLVNHAATPRANVACALWTPPADLPAELAERVPVVRFRGAVAGSALDVVVLVALRHLVPGEELLLDYKFRPALCGDGGERTVPEWMRDEHVAESSV